MSEPAPVTVSAASEKVASPAKKAAKASVKPKKAPKSHPPVSDMIVAAIRTLKERGGSSLQAIKKYLAAQYKVDVEKLAPFIKKYLKSAVAKGQLLQTKGKGASGSFKLPAASKKEAAPKKPKTVKPKSVKPKKAAGEKKKTLAKKSVAKKPKAAGSPTKIKKPVAKSAKKPAIAKPPKNVSAKPKAAAKPKKAAAPKKVATSKKATTKKVSAAKKPTATKKAAK
ncbi:CLUMA_CG020041, isoform A [Clunio marinus]|uniref:CLUMA_CG020041, isoform A n=1 Tax=Clunio marinus TaxID=568069 RepID=A0A1J1J835_9DIPT|nr:CLUMA_CG020041, isoform A [Clunio marinus]